MNYLSRKDAWLNSDKVSESEKEWIRKSDDNTLREMFSTNLAFGTGGMRALLGPGSARLNLLTVRRATIGVGKFLLSKYGPDACKKRGFAISFDNRHMSKEFRDICCKVLTEMGFDVYTFLNPHPTPELSYTVRHFHCVGGVMITASHNPKEYNGYKFYDEKGCQGVYEIVDQLISVITSLPNELTVDYEKVDKAFQGKVTYLDRDSSYDIAFVNRELKTSLYKDVFQGPRLTKIVFSPECGADCIVGPMTLRGAGYEVVTVPGQDFFDPDFKGTKNPNPETDGAYEGAYQTIEKLNAEGRKFNLILVTDPDADRCGLAFLNSKGQIERLTGNQTGALLIDFVLRTKKERNELDSSGVVCNTFVTGNQGAMVAKLYGVKVRTTATGFKYIGTMADLLQKNGETYLFGYEESYGYLLVDFVRDKDSLQSILAIADMTEYYLRQGKTLDVAYQELSERTGLFFNDQVSVYFYGADSQKKMGEEIEKLRENPPSEIAGEKVKVLYDYGKRFVTDFEKKTKMPLVDHDIDYNDCLKFVFPDDSFMAIRPSGTEPKVKFYVEVRGKKDEEARAIMMARVDAVKKIMGL